MSRSAELRSNRLRLEYEANPKRCLYCDAVIPYERRRTKFCNHSCSAKFNNRGVTRHIKGTKVCECGNPKQVQNKYCEKCFASHRYHRTLKLEDAQSDATRRKVLISERGHQCELCGLTEWMNYPVPLEMHHKSGDTDDNTHENLVLLCPNCHSVTQSDQGVVRGKNGKRQQMRRKRYAEGKTW